MNMDFSTSHDTPLGNNSMIANLTEDLPNFNFLEEVQTHLAYKIASYINDYWFPILAPIGLIGNTLSFLVMIKPNNRKMSTVEYWID